MKNNDEILSFKITEADQSFKRLDLFLVSKLPGLSRSVVKKLHEQGHIQSENTKLELKKMPPINTVVLLELPEPEPMEAQAQNIPLDILYEDEHLIIVNKPAGMVVHPAAGNPDGTLVNAILWHCPDLKGIGNIKRPGIVHRLDKGTSGVMVVAKEQKCHEALVDIFSRHDIERRYEAIVLGIRISPQGTIESTIGRNPGNRLKMKAQVTRGKNAITHYKVLNYFKNTSHLELKLETGRTHQIRVHLSEVLNKPILNDPVYGQLQEEKKRVNAQIFKFYSTYEHPFLHAKILGFKHPITQKKLYFEQEIPEIFAKTLELLKDE